MIKNIFTLWAASFLSLAAFADNVVHPGSPTLERPTLTSLGIRLPITGDDNFNATAALSYRLSGTNTWSPALPLFRVHPEVVSGYSAQSEFAGSVFNLRANTSYDLQLHLTDPNGGVDQTWTLTQSTRPVPSDPANPRNIYVNNSGALYSAVASAQPGDIITLADGMYNVQSLYVNASGTATQPIVIRGTSEEGTVLDGANCGGCNIIEVYGSYVHLEQMTLQNAQRAIRFQTAGTHDNVVRRVHVKNTDMGIMARSDQLDYYIADNILQGRLAWPQTWATDGAAHSGNDGISMTGSGMVIAHNQIAGYADAMKTEQLGARDNDFYGNDILYTYDDGIELDESSGNVRCMRNRFTNVYDGLSFQPIFGGPVYAFQNVLVNVASEELKIHDLGTGSGYEDPSGILLYNNTIVSAAYDLFNGSGLPNHYFSVENNLFIGPQYPSWKALEWDAPIDHGTFDYNGYFGDGEFTFNILNSGYQNFGNFAALQQSNTGLEAHGVLLTGQVFASGLTAPGNSSQFLSPQDVTLAGGSGAIDRAVLLPNINDAFSGSAPDIGAIEAGCPQPTYGPRPPGVDESNEAFGCSSPAPSAPSDPPASVPPSNTESAPPSNSQSSWVNIISKHSGKCLDVIGGNGATAQGIQLDQWDCWGGDNQKFQLTPVTGGFEITVKNSGLQLDVAGGPSATYDGANIIQWQYWGGSNEIWQLTSTGDGYYTLNSTSSGKCMDVTGASQGDGAAVIQWSCWGGDNQRWQVVPAQ